MDRTFPSLNWRLPLMVMVLCYAGLASLTVVSYVPMRHQAARDGEMVYVYNFRPTSTMGQKQLLLASVIRAGGFASPPVQALNLPAIMIEMVVDRAVGAWPDSWQPAMFGPSVGEWSPWRAVIFPVYCLPFWWFAGVGLDALFARRRLRWPVFLLGALLSGFFVFIGCGLRFGLDASDRVDMAFVYWGLGLWATLYLAFPVAWVRQFRARRQVVAVGAG